MLLSDLPIGTKVADVNSKYNNKIIIWTVASKNHYGSNEITLISDVLFKKSMDAKEPNQSNSRASYGNNHYSVSNLHQWLNSKKTSWYSPMHSLDAPPITENVIGTEYESEKGFMTNFSNKFLDKVKDTTFKTALHSLDGTGLETTVAKFFIPSCAEVGFGNENGLSEGKIFSLFSDSSNLKATFEGNAIGYYLRTPETKNNKYDYKIVRDTGEKYTNAACNAKVGTRVVCNIDANIEVENKTSYYKLKLSNYLNENTSLSNALTSLSNKKDDIKAMKNNLYSILSEKSVECSEDDRMSSLIDKVNTITMKTVPGDTYYHYYDNHEANLPNSMTLISRFKIKDLEGGYRLSFYSSHTTAVSSGSIGTYLIQVFRKGNVISSKEIVTGSVSSAYEIDFTSLQKGDIVELQGKRNSSGSAYWVMCMYSNLTFDLVI